MHPLTGPPADGVISGNPSHCPTMVRSAGGRVVGRVEHLLDDKASIQNRAFSWGVIYCISLSHIARAHHGLLSCLSAEELERSGRFHRDIDRLRFVACRAVLRCALAQLHGMDLREIKVSIQPCGKPYLSRPGAPFFSVSHGGDWGLVAISSSCEVGVDVEPVRPVDTLDAMAQEVFTPAELSIYRGLKQGDRRDCFFAVWVQKEALLKVRGAAPHGGWRGVSSTLIRAHDIPYGFRGDPRLFFLDLDSGHRAAVALGRPPGGILTD